MRRIGTVLIAAAILLLAGCGGDGSSVESLDDLGAMLEEQDIDCSDLRADSDELFVREGGNCEDGELAVYVFNDSENRDNYLDVASEFGGGPYVVGENWVVEMPDDDSAEELADGLDAEVR
ncbi:hypothetical protein BH20ACT23_BH20ACT23_19930 [soil metagenome]